MNSRAKNLKITILRGKQFGQHTDVVQFIKRTAAPTSVLHVGIANCSVL